MVSSLTVDPRETSEGDRQTMLQRLQRALQASTTGRTPGQAVPPPLQLQDFTASGIGVSPGVLAALAPTQLQRVVLHFKRPYDELSPAACVALGKLRSLRELVFFYDPVFVSSEPTYLPFDGLSESIGELTRLTSLTLLHDDPANLEQLPRSLRSLTLNLHPVTDAPAGLQLVPLEVEAAVAAAQFLAVDMAAAAAVAPLLPRDFRDDWELMLEELLPLPADWQAVVQGPMYVYDMDPVLGAAPGDLDLLPLHWQAALLPAAGIAALHNGAQGSAADGVRDLRHLTALQVLTIKPTQHSGNPIPFKLPGHLRSLQVCNCDVWLLGPHMPEHVDLTFSHTSHLNVLQDLSEQQQQQQQPWSLELRAGDHSAVALERGAGAALAACTSLTALVIEPLGSLPWARHVAALSNLRRLELGSSAQDKAWQGPDLLRLTALTALTHLAVLCGVSDMAAASLGHDLTGLQHLELSCEKLQTARVLTTAAKLSSLQHLHLIVWARDNAPPARNGAEQAEEDARNRGEWWSGWDVSTAITPAVLSQLLPLTQLSYLHLPLGAACPEEARQQFLRSMPRLSRIETAACKRRSHNDR